MNILKKLLTGTLLATLLIFGNALNGNNNTKTKAKKAPKGKQIKQEAPTRTETQRIVVEPIKNRDEDSDEPVPTRPSRKEQMHQLGSLLEKRRHRLRHERRRERTPELEERARDTAVRAELVNELKQDLEQLAAYLQTTSLTPTIPEEQKQAITEVLGNIAFLIGRYNRAHLLDEATNEALTQSLEIVYNTILKAGLVEVITNLSAHNPEATEPTVTEIASSMREKLNRMGDWIKGIARSMSPTVPDHEHAAPSVIERAQSMIDPLQKALTWTVLALDKSPGYKESLKKLEEKGHLKMLLTCAPEHLKAVAAAAIFGVAHDIVMGSTSTVLSFAGGVVSYIPYVGSIAAPVFYFQYYVPTVITLVLARMMLSSAWKATKFIGPMPYYFGPATFITTLTTEALSILDSIKNFPAFKSGDSYETSVQTAKHLISVGTLFLGRALGWGLLGGAWSGVTSRLPWGGSTTAAPVTPPAAVPPLEEVQSTGWFTSVKNSLFGEEIPRGAYPEPAPSGYYPQPAPRGYYPQPPAEGLPQKSWMDSARSWLPSWESTGQSQPPIPAEPQGAAGLADIF